MSIDIIAIGNKMPAWVEQGYHDYCSRLPKQLEINLIEIPLVKRTKNTSTNAVKSKESSLIQRSIKPSSHVVALTIPGKKLNSTQFADKVKPYVIGGHHLSLLIGGPDGLATDLIEQAHEQWSLSELTLPHPLVRIVLIESIYRAYTILNNHPYHK